MHSALLSKNHLSSLQKLKQKKYRQLEGKTIVEGWNLISQLLDNGYSPLELIGDVEQPPVQDFTGSGFPLYLAKQHELQSLADTESPQSILAVYALPVHQLKAYRAIFYLDQIQDPGNLGTIFRIAAAFGLDAVVMSSGCCEVFSPKVIRASLGSVFWLPSRVEDYAWFAAQQAVKVGLRGESELTVLEFQPDKTLPLIIVIGSEGAGISPELCSLLDASVRIPISTQMESLNASVAAGIAAYQYKVLTP